MKSIALITCWYGPFPWYFPYFVFSCKYNPTVDFIIVTDNEDEIQNKPDNFKIIYTKFEDLKSNFSEKMGFKVSLDYPYKLCDFKPAYGYLFPDIIKKYDFWGHIDLDIVFGDIREFITDELLSNYDVISSRHDYTAGYFTLFRNQQYLNTLFKRSKDYIKIFTKPQNFWFDECGSLTCKLKNANDVLFCANDIESMTYVVKMAEKESGLRSYFDFMVIDGLPGKIHWKNGKIYYKDTFEAIFYHLIQFKNKCKKKTILTPIPNEFFFTKSRILKSKNIK